VAGNYLSLSGKEITAGTVPISLGGTGGGALTITSDTATVSGACISNDAPIFIVEDTSISYGEPTMEVRGSYDCSLRIEADGGEAYLEIANISASTGDTDDSWGIGSNDNTNLHFSWGSNHTLNKTDIMELRSSGDYLMEVYGDVMATSYSPFTGVHSCLGSSLTNEHIGLLCNSTNNIVNIDNTILPKISETLPIVELCSTEKSKKILGILSVKSTLGSFRCQINSLGEGGIWITNKNGDIEIGDYITSSSIPGYGQKQSETQLHNFTVAKSLSDCSFSIQKINKRKVKVITSIQTTLKETKTLTTLDLDSSGNVQFEDDLDLDGNQQQVYSYTTRFLLSDGTQITESDYTTRLSNGESVYVACFLGCTYHCG
jgi:hypothetical protein